MASVLLSNLKSFSVGDGITLLEGARHAGIILQHSCKTGRCGTCRVRMTRGAVRTIGADTSLAATDRADGWILTCTDAPATDEIHLDAEDISVLADFPSRTTPCRIDALERLAPDVMRVVLRFPPKASPNYLPGQYVDVIGTGGVRRSYSIANQPGDDGKIEMHIRMVDGGKMSAYWFGAAKAGDLLRLEGPKGSFFLRDVSALNLVFLATGTGIAPVKAILEGLAHRVAGGMPRSVTVLWGGRHQEDLYWSPEIPGIESLDFVPVLSRAGAGWTGSRGHVQDVLMQRDPDWTRTVVYACGSQAMIDSAATQLCAAGLSPRHFFSDAFVSSSI